MRARWSLACPLGLLAMGCHDPAAEPEHDAPAAREVVDGVAIHRDAAGQVVRVVPPRDSGLAPTAFFDAHGGATYGLGPEDEMILAGEEAGPDQRTFARYVQRHQGVDVMAGGVVLVVGPDGIVEAAVGRPVAGLVASIRPALTAEGAAELAERAAEAQRGSPSEATEAIGTPALLLAPDGRAGHRLKWRVRLRGGTAVVDDADGTVRLIGSARAWSPIPGQGPTPFDGTVAVDASADSATDDCVLFSDDVHTRRVIVPPVSDPVDYMDYDEYAPASINAYGTSNGALCAMESDEVVAVGIHWGAERSMAYLSERHGRDGWDGDGGRLEAFIDVPLTDAAFRPFPPHIAFGTELVDEFSLDTVAHEVVHAVAADEIFGWPQPGFEDVGEPGALAESFADVLATFVEAHTRGLPADWVFDQDGHPLYGLRLLSDPHGHPEPQPDTYLVDPHWIPNDTAIHHNSTVPSYAWYLLTIGEQGTNAAGQAYDVVGVGDAVTSIMAYVAMVYLLDGSSDFSEAREATIEAARIVCKAGSQAYASAQDAWGAVAVGPPAPPAQTVPADGATDVDPWVGPLRWEAHTADAWTVQASTTADFSADVHTTTTTTVNVVNGVPMGEAMVADLSLELSTTYHWRVRPEPEPLDADYECWSPVWSFTTADKKGETVTPTMENSPFQPWLLRFGWKGVPGADSYDVEVFESACSSRPITKADQVADKQIKLVTKVDRPQWWRVRPRGPGDSLGSWSDCTAFTTSMPAVDLVAPGHTTAQYPWNIELRWTEVFAARAYTLEMTEGREGWDDPASETDVYPETTETHQRVDVIPRRTHEGYKHWWRVRVHGPAPFFEDGAPSDEWYFLNDGDATSPKSVAPSHSLDKDPNQPGQFAWIPYGDGVTFTWQEVPEAEVYRLRVWSFLSKPPGFEADFSQPIFVEDVVAAGTGGTQSIQVPGAVVSTPFHGAEVYGYWYTVQTLGPAGATPNGFDAEANVMCVGPCLQGDDLYYVQAPPATAEGEGLVDSDGDGKFDWSSESSHSIDLVASQSPAWSPTGQYEFEVFEFPMCVGSPVDEGVISGRTFTTTAFAPDPDHPDDAVFLWYRVRVRGTYGAFHENEPNGGWSACTGLEIEPAAVSEAPEVKNWAGANWLGTVLLAFKKVPGAATYQIQVYPPGVTDTPMWEDQVDKSDAAQQTSSFSQAQGLNVGTGWFAWLDNVDGTTAGTNEAAQYRVRGCNADGACGPYSSWSTYCSKVADSSCVGSSWPW